MMAHLAHPPHCSTNILFGCSSRFSYSCIPSSFLCMSWEAMQDGWITALGSFTYVGDPEGDPDFRSTQVW